MIEYIALRNKIALITGGGTGLGFGIAAAFCDYGIKTVITGRREDVLKEACVKLNAGPARANVPAESARPAGASPLLDQPGTASYIVHDINRLDTIPHLVAEVEETHGPIDILVNNAGIHIKKDAIDFTDEDYEQVILTNQRAVFALTREVAERMQARGGGNILMISSMASHYGIPKVIAYTAAKSAVEGMTRALAVELSPHGIRVNCIAPGFIKTAMSAKALEVDPERLEKVLSRTPLGRLGEPEDVANAALYLVSDAAKYVTGVVLPVDGGNSIGF